MDHFAILKSELPAYTAVASKAGDLRLFGQEVLRFYSMAGTIMENFKVEGASIDERYITHVLARSVIEGFFWQTYIFWDPAQRQSRFEEFISSFKRDYGKLYNEKIFPQKSKIEPADAAWAAIPKGLNVSSMLAQLKNDMGDRLDYLYLVYRITSFDTHGKNLNAVFEHVFGKRSTFPVLDLRLTFDLNGTYLSPHSLLLLENPGSRQVSRFSE